MGKRSQKLKRGMAHGDSGNIINGTSQALDYYAFIWVEKTR